MNRDTSPVTSLFNRVRSIVESARAGAARSVNSAQVISNWLIGREIVEELQRGSRRAGYGERLIANLSLRMRKNFGSGYSENNLEHFRDFYATYPGLLLHRISHALRGESSVRPGTRIPHAARGLLENGGMLPVISEALPRKSWKPGLLHPTLSWTHYRMLLKADEPDKRAFYEIEAIKNNWSARELERQMASLLYERLRLSRDKRGLLRPATKGHEVRKPSDVFKDPMVMEFLGLPESPTLVESDLEQALITNLRSFLLELGKGFAFVSRQERLTLDGDRFYVDLVFYHTILKCYILIDLKTGKLTHQDLGQMQLYVNYYDRERCSPGDNPTLGLILCAKKNDAVVRYTLGEKSRRIFASRYKLYLPTEKQLTKEIRRELREFRPGESHAQEKSGSQRHQVGRPGGFL
jgi:predicted nuclease of restriction endonuclease-like (RecB) superfamily